MKWGVLVFPGSNDDQDALWALSSVHRQEAIPLWHKDPDLRGVDAVVVPGGFSYGDYLRCGAMARFSPVMQSVRAFAAAGGIVLGMCNGFQILCEAGLLPGALVRNRSLTFVCKRVWLRVENDRTALTRCCREGERLQIPIKHGEGCYFADESTLRDLEARGQVLFRYVDAAGEATPEANPNGALRSIAGVMNASGNVFGMMPHPEHAVEAIVGGEDGRKLFQSLIEELEERAARGGGSRRRTTGRAT
ncbi:MAG: phosphoribosylformylglycinamidine synthase subunit PurQ [Deltaproteobacteria bacterium]|nr:phosphoribosylformylglycinamidine synthase subunit PurQ [Deltaproteobacteria bacterium]